MSRLGLTSLGQEVRETKKCVYCKDEFDATVYKFRKYCPGRKCRQLAYEERHAKEIEAKKELKKLTGLKERLERDIRNKQSRLFSVNLRLNSMELDK